MAKTQQQLEKQKNTRIDEVAELAGKGLISSSADARQTGEFLHHYFRHVDAHEVVDRSAQQLLDLVKSHLQLARHREPGELNLAIVDDEVAGVEPGTTVVQMVNDDRPFLVDSLSMEVVRQGWDLREIYHPQFVVVRRDGDLVSVLPLEHEHAQGSLQESWIHLELIPPLNMDESTGRRELQEGLRQAVQSVEEAVDDWQAMRTRMAETVTWLQDNPVPYPYATVRSVMEFLNWLIENHFTFLGSREYRFVDGAAPRYEPVPGTGLGMLRGDEQDEDAFAALPATDKEPQLVVITKDDRTSRVHRPAQLDYVGVRTFDRAGNIVGERRFLGLFAARAYTDSVSQIPLLKDKAKLILSSSGYAEDSHGANAIAATIENYPRDELFQTRPEVLAPIVEQISRLRERRQVRLFTRRDHYGRFVSCLVFLPRDRYTTRIRNLVEKTLYDRLGGVEVDFQARANESVLARLHLVVRMAPGHEIGEIDNTALERELTEVTRSWDDSFAEQARADAELARLAPLAAVLPEGYKEDFSPRHAMMDIAAVVALKNSAEDMSTVLYVPDEADDRADLRLKVFRLGSAISLSSVMPHLSLLGVTVIDERPYGFEMPTGERGFVYDFGLLVPGGADQRSRWTEEARTRFTEAFTASYQDRCEADRLNGLVVSAELEWHEVAWLRAISRYLQQTGAAWSQDYIAESLLAQVSLVRRLVELFRVRFDPSAAGGVPVAERGEACEKLNAEILAGLDEVESIDHDRIVRTFLAVINAVIRTNAFRSDRQALAMKLLPREIPDLPQPRPEFEIFVCSPQLEGVHLRFGQVARGGLRWSDRREDFRTEVLGLVKAQMVKNTVIVPVGAKGGFFCKRLPDPAADRTAWFEAGRECYRVFVNSLLDVTDNIVDAEIDPPTDVLRHDGDDPYLVVAADKGTATFSDTANEISLRRGFWLGDAFASGGSAGYDHKAMGITARGAWVSVQRHFREMGVDCQNEDFTCVGIGDMSGDVFGNGMLLSKHIKLVAAFNHQHIFVDPDPDPARTWTERKRLFDEGGNWSAYDTSLISEGGGIHSRTQKSIPITAEVRAMLGLEDSVTQLAPNDLVQAILKAPVDLLWNGGIGTYVKASTETHAQVGDKSNDAVRVNGADLQCKAVGEGGNLGLTQLGRIEYARTGGRINTDFIDNSAGVDTSDHEVNIKILLAGEIDSGNLAADDRNALLESMTDEVAELVLAHNYDQNLALANAADQAAPMAGMHERWMRKMEDEGLLDRRIEAMPSSADMADRVRDGEGLTTPELCTLMSYSKIWWEREILASDLPDDPYLADRLIQYFPQPLREKYAEGMHKHRLHREIITTVAVNRFVNSAGSTALFRIAEETGAKPEDVIRAQLAVRAIFRIGLHEVQCARLDNQVEAQVQTEIRLELRRLVERGTRWVLANRRAPIDVPAAVEQFTEGVQQVTEELPQLVVGHAAQTQAERLESLLEQGIPTELADVTASAPMLHQALWIVQIAQQHDVEVLRVAKLHFALAQELGLDILRERIAELPRQDRWDDMARSALRDDLLQVQAQLISEALDAAPDQRDPQQVLTAWEERVGDLEAARDTVLAVSREGADLARLSVGLRQVRGLLSPLN